MAISKYNVLTILILLVFVPYMLQEPGYLDNRHAYAGLVPLLAAGLLFVPMGFHLRKANKYSEMAAMLAILALAIGVGIPTIVIVLSFMAKGGVLLAFNTPFYYIGIILSNLAMIYQIGALFKKGK